MPGQEQTPEQRPSREVSLGQGPEVIRKSSEEPRKMLSAVHRRTQGNCSRSKSPLFQGDFFLLKRISNFSGLKGVETS